mmetsp:Transcript_106562/g.311509  ORF Transcript_106562/g.311509 Transcript_106562/m.311509 type:complete len:232 (-) Transcript_106562:65-760(-)
MLGGHIHAIVPRAWVQVDAEPLRHQEGAHVLRADVVTSGGWTQADDKGHRLPRPEELASVRVVVAHPQEDRISTGRSLPRGLLGQGAQALDVFVVLRGHSQVFRVVEFAAPLHLEVSLSGAGLVACAWVQRPPAGLGPAGDLEGAAGDGEVFRVADQEAEALERFVGRQLPLHLAHGEAYGQLRGAEVLWGEEVGGRGPPCRLQAARARGGCAREIERQQTCAHPRVPKAA